MSKNKILNRLTSLFLVLVMAFTLLPSQVFAGVNFNTTPSNSAKGKADGNFSLAGKPDGYKQTFLILQSTRWTSCKIVL